MQCELSLVDYGDRFGTVLVTANANSMVYGLHIVSVGVATIIQYLTHVSGIECVDEHAEMVYLPLTQFSKYIYLTQYFTRSRLVWVMDLNP